ncbi:MAG: acyl-CoA desaturase, partial [Oscillatoriales cyanobacterium]
DSSTNCWWVAVLTYGEGWHNNHHAYQYSARHGMQWWEFDFTWVTIQVLEALGLASKVKLPPSRAEG